jgi:chaperonin GroEL
MAKELKFNADARESLLSGIGKLTDAVKVTMGGRGRSVMITNGKGSPIVTQDGVTVAKHFSLKDRYENLGSEMVKSVSHKTQMSAGDGTTTATVLANAIAVIGAKRISDGSCPMRFQEGVKQALNDVTEELLKLTIPIETTQDIYNIALISSKGDTELAELISSAMEKVGSEGVITIDESKNDKTTLTTVEGIKFDRGFPSPYFITNKQKNTVEFSNVHYIIANKVIGSLAEVQPFLEFSNKNSIPVVFIADEFSTEVQEVVLQNYNSGTTKLITIKAPSFGDYRADLLKDIGIAVNAKVFGEHAKLEDFKADDFGFSKKIIVDKGSTLIVEGAFDETELGNYVSDLTESKDLMQSERPKKVLQQRIASLVGGIGKISVGGVSEEEMKERKDRVDDALSATRSAVEEGFVAGGGVAFLHISDLLEGKVLKDKELQVGYNALLDAIKVPFNQILDNAGYTEGEYQVARGNAKAYPQGENVRTKKCVNMLLDGVIDPVKVTRIALKNAVSIATLLLTTECIMVDEDEFIA